MKPRTAKACGFSKSAKRPAQDVMSKRSAPTWTPRLQRRFTDWIEKWRGLLLLNGHHINVCFSATPKDANGDTRSELSGTCAADMRASSVYLSGHTMTIYPHALTITDLNEQERCVVHELCHIVTEQSKELSRHLLNDKRVVWREVIETNERMTDWIANLAWALHDLN